MRMSGVSLRVSASMRWFAETLIHTESLRRESAPVIKSDGCRVVRSHAKPNTVEALPLCPFFCYGDQCFADALTSEGLCDKKFQKIGLGSAGEPTSL